MEKDVINHQPSSETPRVSQEIIDSLPSIDDESAQNQLWRSFGQEESELARKGLVLAKELRDRGADPGDALLIGMRMAHAGLRGQSELTKLRDQLEVNEASIYPGQNEIDDNIDGSVSSLQRWRQRRKISRESRRAQRHAVGLGAAYVVARIISRTSKPDV